MIDAPASSLPLSPTLLLGRDAELTHLRSILTAGDVRLVTLTGPGGIGKTRLALELARSLENEYAHGTHFVALATVTDPTLVPAAVAEILRVPATTADTVTEALRDHHGLIVLDNLEHLLDVAAPWAAELVARCPRMQVLVTSRVPLHVRGERVATVEPLALPSGDVAPQSVASVALFTLRARDANPAFTITAANAASVAGICRHLDGIPLAIELAAARVDMLDPAALLRRLRTQGAMLSDGPRDAPERHRTMTGAIRWSLDLLSAPERHLFGQLCAFTGTFSLDAAEGLAGEHGLELLTVLRHHSLIRPAPGLPGDSRFSMLEPIRQAGLELLRREGTLDAARDAVTAWLLGQARRAEAALSDDGDVAPMDRLEEDRATIWAMLDRSVAQGRIDDALNLAGTIWRFRRQRGEGSDASALLVRLLAHPEAQPPTVRRARALALLGVCASEQRDSTIAPAAYREALAICRTLEADIEVAWVLKDLSFVFTTGELTAAVAAMEESLARAQAAGNDWAAAAALDQVGGLYMYQNRTADALRCLQESEGIAHRRDDDVAVINTLVFQGMLYIRTGELERAEDRLTTCIELCERHGDPVHGPMARMVLGEVRRLRGDAATAEELTQGAVLEMRAAGWLHGTAVGLAALACHALQRNAPRDAAGLLRESASMFGRIGLRYGLQHGSPICFDGMAWLAHVTGDANGAARFLGMADGLYRRMGIERPEGAPMFADAAVVERLRRSLDRPGMRVSWLAGFDLSDAAMLSEVVTYRPALPRVESPPQAQPLPGVARGLSTRELEVLRLMADGLTNQEIADRLFVSVRTVAGHVASILDKLHLASRTGAVAWAIRNGLA